MIRLAGAPISWGVCEVPGWGLRLPTDRVLDEMAGLGLTATEFGPLDFLPADPAAAAGTLRRHGLGAVGGFLPVVLHEPAYDPLTDVSTALERYPATGADTLVLAAATGSAGYDASPELDPTGWRTLLVNLDRIAAHAAERGITAALHPHVGTMVEREADVLGVLDGCDIPLCLDTGHLLVGGADPVRLATEAAGRVAHVHLKDVDAGHARRVRDGDLSYTEAVRAGLYRPLGAGDVDVPAIVAALEGAGYRGWYVLEQDTMLAAEPAPGAGPVGDVRASLRYLASVR